MTRSPGPQLEQGHTRIANELLEQLAIHLTASGTQLALMLLVMRFSYGFQRKWADFTISELATKLKIDRKSARRALQALVQKNMLTMTAKPGHQRQRFQINKDYKKWV